MGCESPLLFLEIQSSSHITGVKGELGLGDLKQVVIINSRGKEASFALGKIVIVSEVKKLLNVDNQGLCWLVCPRLH